MTSFITDYWKENIKFYLEHSTFKTTEHKNPLIIILKALVIISLKST